MNVKIYQCFRTGASQSIHNMHGSRNFHQGGRGSRPDDQKRNSLDNVVCFFFVFFLFSPQLILQFTEVVQRFFFRGGPTFSKGGGGSNFFEGGGVQMLISIETHITCDFPVGSPPPIPPWDPRMHDNLYLSCSSLL